MRIWKGDDGILSPGMPKLQRTKENVKRRSGKEEDANGYIARRSEGYQTQAGIYQRNKEIRYELMKKL